MEFKLKADFVFSANDVEDAFLKIAEHFKNLSNGEIKNSIAGIGEIRVQPMESKISAGIRFHYG
jgi:hypothetical protein